MIFMKIQYLNKTKMKSILIIGASKGLGKELANNFIHDEYKCLLISRKIKQSVKIKNTTYLNIDISKQKDRKKLLTYINKHNLSFDIIVNNASYQLKKNINDCNINDIMKIYKNNFFSYFFLYQELITYLKDKSFIINISAYSSIYPNNPGFSLYNSSKASLNSFIDNLVIENKSLCAVTFLLGGFSSDTYKRLNKSKNINNIPSPKIIADFIYKKINTIKFKNYHFMYKRDYTKINYFRKFKI